jgi:hypothetical protein
MSTPFESTQSSEVLSVQFFISHNTLCSFTADTDLFNGENQEHT